MISKNSGADPKRSGKRALKEEHHTEGTEVTEVRSKINQKSKPHRRKLHFSPGGLANPQDIAPGVAFQASSDSGWMTGERLYSDCNIPGATNAP
jgi:NAD(P)-dependent dehydrogenase (short-subunit alcohol dehydrogenase family)